MRLNKFEVEVKEAYSAAGNSDEIWRTQTVGVIYDVKHDCFSVTCAVVAKRISSYYKHKELVAIFNYFPIFDTFYTEVKEGYDIVHDYLERQKELKSKEC